MSDALPRVIRTVRLRIANQARIVNQIAGTYKDAYRALMEYVDNAADAAATDPNKPRHLTVEVDSPSHSVTFEDDCSGMDAEKLSDLLGSIGTSSKAHLPWVNGEFGFGVHAFRAFARYIEFVSRVRGGNTCGITIDRETDENTEVPITSVEPSAISSPSGTRIRIHGFRPGVFKGPRFASGLQREIEEHFGDVIDNGILEVRVKDSRVGTFDVCKPIEIGALPGTPIRVSVPVETPAGILTLEVNAKLVDGPPVHHPIVLTRNGRRILPVGDLRSFKMHLKGKNRLNDVWHHPQLTGRIEIADIAQPNITRDDLQPSEGRDTLYEALESVQNDLEGAIAASESKQRDRQLDSASRVLSERLAHVMRKFSTTFRRPVSGAGTPSSAGSSETGVQPGGELPGGGGLGSVPGAGSLGSSGTTGGTALGKGDLGSGDRGAHEGGGPSDQSGESTLAPGGPELLFAHLDPAVRCRIVGYQITVNVDHPAYLSRVTRDGLDERLLSHVARIISPHLTERVYETRSIVPTPMEFGEKTVELGILLEDDFMDHESEIALALKSAESSE